MLCLTDASCNFFSESTLPDAIQVPGDACLQFPPSGLLGAQPIPMEMAAEPRGCQKPRSEGIQQQVATHGHG